MRLGNLGIDPLTATGIAVTGATGLFSIGSQIFGGSQQQAELQADLRKAKQAEIEEARKQAQMLAQAQTAQQQQQIYELSKARRSEQTMVLVGVASLAVLFSGVFLYSAFKKRRVS